MTADQRLRAARAFWSEEQAADDHIQAILLIAQQKKFRPKFVAGLDIERRAKHLSGLLGLPEPVTRASADSAEPLMPTSGPSYRPVRTLNGWTLPWRMKDGVKEFHLVAEPVEREIAPGMVARLWGYNGQSPGPTIEVVEGDQIGRAHV